MPVIPSFDFVPPLSDIHLLKQRCPLKPCWTWLRGHPPMALHQELNLKDGKVPCTLPVHLHRLVERSKAKSGHRASGGKVELPPAPLSTQTVRPPPASPRPNPTDALGSRLITHAPSAIRASECEDSGGCSVSATQTTRYSAELASLCEPGVRIFQGRAGPLVWALGLSSEHLGLVRLSGQWGPAAAVWALNTKCPAQDQLGDSLLPLCLGMWYQ